MKNINNKKLNKMKFNCSCLHIPQNSFANENRFIDARTRFFDFKNSPMALLAGLKLQNPLMIRRFEVIELAKQLE
jgi:hypothetical protein